MKYNTAPDFIGIDGLKQVHGRQIEEFERWAARNDWAMFHHSHYDWWVFPINRRSSYGLKYVVYDGDVADLKRDAHFVRAYLTGVQLVSASWGWDLLAKSHILCPSPGQCWHQWPIRLYKAAQSVKLFGYEDVFDSLRVYAIDLMREGETMSYGGKDLSWIFR